MGIKEKDLYSSIKENPEGWKKLVEEIAAGKYEPENLKKDLLRKNPWFDIDARHNIFPWNKYARIFKRSAPNF